MVTNFDPNLWIVTNMDSYFKSLMGKYGACLIGKRAGTSSSIMLYKNTVPQSFRLHATFTMAGVASNVVPLSTGFTITVYAGTSARLLVSVLFRLNGKAELIKPVSNSIGCSFFGSQFNENQIQTRFTYSDGAAAIFVQDLLGGINCTLKTTLASANGEPLMLFLEPGERAVAMLTDLWLESITPSPSSPMPTPTGGEPRTLNLGLMTLAHIYIFNNLLSFLQCC